MIKRALKYGLAFTIAMTQVTQARAGWLQDRVNDVKRIVKEVPKIANPAVGAVSIAKDIVQGAPPDQAVKNFVQGHAQSLGRVVQSTRNLSNVPSDVAGMLPGKVGTLAQTAVTLSGASILGVQEKEFVFTALESGLNIIQGQDPLVSIAIPVAAAIRDAHAKYAPVAKPYPEEVIQILKHVIPEQLLREARYTTDNLKIAVPGMLNGGVFIIGTFEESVLGRDNVRKYNATTVGNISVYSRELDFNNINDLVWIAHEVFHTRQFKEWGIDLFAYRYTKNKGAVEGEAEAAESYVRTFLTQLVNRQPIQPYVTAHYNPASSRPVAIATPLGPTMIMAPVGTPTLGAAPGATGDAAFIPQAGVINNYTDRCVIQGEQMFITADHRLVSPGAGLVVGHRSAPMDGRCYFDLHIPMRGMHACVWPNGTVSAGPVVGSCGPMPR
jgi:hypothetical protein